MGGTQTLTLQTPRESIGGPGLMDGSMLQSFSCTVVAAAYLVVYRVKYGEIYKVELEVILPWHDVFITH